MPRRGVGLAAHGILRSATGAACTTQHERERSDTHHSTQTSRKTDVPPRNHPRDSSMVANWFAFLNRKPRSRRSQSSKPELIARGFARSAAYDDPAASPPLPACLGGLALPLCRLIRASPGLNSFRWVLNPLLPLLLPLLPRVMDHHLHCTRPSRLPLPQQLPARCLRLLPPQQTPRSLP
jgi:hypothetical protein